MGKPIEYQTIYKDGEPEFAVVPFDQFKELLESRSDVEPTIPHTVVSAVVDGESPVRAWRKYLKLTQDQVADSLKISQPAYAQMEKTDANLRGSTITKIANTFGIMVQQLDV